ncbi:sulfatase-like hydrolase/transferase [Neorhodopirellula lusitana]|uniref:sulfatase-like hydrolase/transferase n=1 Tax=Neorhodopirellula lusitana TaxID=445327 RepID=UPI00384D2FDC
MKVVVDQVAFWRTVSLWAVAALRPVCGLIAVLPIAAICVGNELRNVVVILSDDQGWGDLSVNGNVNLSTPNIDSLATDGASFGRFYVCPVCAPTRAEFLTGRYHPRGGVSGVSEGAERLNLDEVTIADTFRASGYATGAFGKWHNGMQYPYHPNGRGFDQFYGFCSGHWGQYFDPMFERNGRLVRGNGFCIDDFTDQAIAFIEDSLQHDKPFFAYLPYNTPHSPMQVPDRFYRKFSDADLALRDREPDREDLAHTRAALAMCENIDWNVGRLLKKLDELDVSENTIVVYFCDNGPNGRRWNGDMKGRKGSTDEGGVRSPTLVRWPGVISAGKQLSVNGAAIDLLPTLADLAGVEVVGDKPLDGVSLKAPLTGVGDPLEDRMIFTHWNKKVAVRTERFLLDNAGLLYELESDPGQRSDVSPQHRETTRQLKAAVRSWREEMLPGLRNDQRPFVIGHPDYRYTQIPARDGIPSGAIKRSSRHPNCSYLTNWIDTDDVVTWDVQVPADGTFDVEIHYACPVADVGATIALSFGDSRLEGTITEAHDPPLIGEGQDRAVRKESYVKDFRSLKLGTIDLKKGAGPLTLRALEMPGSQVMEFRLIMLTRR